MKVLFVCTGNTCRSVMAEGYLWKFIKQNNAKDMDVKSCGTGASPNFKVPKIVLKLLKDEGVDLSDHVSTPVNKLLVGVSDYIFVMEKRHKEELLRRYPEDKKRIHLLKEFAENMILEDPEVPDPIGQPDEVYIEAATVIEDLVKKSFERIKESK
ncbi:MAG: hypothetical protein A3J83_07795 [Elusimicrobia bacterium RIFOXYA2_FULL_40_6]|nr:MAG: hypothetical protein A3J83_07795 [Elusimicrobia bacterium RIFOXYA2_FULL_40_6]